MRIMLRFDNRINTSEREGMKKLSPYRNQIICYVISFCCSSLTKNVYTPNTDNMDALFKHVSVDEILFLARPIYHTQNVRWMDGAQRYSGLSIPRSCTNVIG